MAIGRGRLLSENRDPEAEGQERDGASMRPAREDQVKLLAGRISCVVGILFGVGGIVAALLGGSANASVGAVGAALGILGYFLGSRRLGTFTVLLCVAALFFGLAASQGLIPGIDASDRGLPAKEPAAE
jgi:hypothetical protein